MAKPAAVITALKSLLQTAEQDHAGNQQRLVEALNNINTRPKIVGRQFEYNLTLHQARGLLTLANGCPEEAWSDLQTAAYYSYLYFAFNHAARENGSDEESAPSIVTDYQWDHFMMTPLFNTWNQLAIEGAAILYAGRARNRYFHQPVEPVPEAKFMALLGLIPTFGIQRVCGWAASHPIGPYADILAFWAGPDDRLASSITAILDHHLQVARKKEKSFAEPEYKLWPVELLAIQRIRRETGLQTPSIDHPLTTNNPFYREVPRLTSSPVLPAAGVEIVARTITAEYEASLLRKIEALLDSK